MALPMLMVSAQSAIPPGWTARQEPGKTIVTPIATRDGAVAITIYAQEELNGARHSLWAEILNLHTRFLPLIELSLDIPASSVRPGFNGCNTDIQSLRCLLGGVLMNKTQFKYGAAARR
jgi:hypothetical protein